MSKYLSAKNGTIQSILLAYVLFFVVFFCGYAIVGRKEAIPSYAIALQVYYAGAYLTCMVACLHMKGLKAILLTVFFYTLLSSLLMRIVSWEYLDEPFFNAVDSVTYDNFARRALNRFMSLREYADYFLSRFHLDDSGMFLIVYFVYTLMGNVSGGQWAMLLLNAIVITLTAYRMFRLLDETSTPRTIRNFCVVAFSCMPFLSLTAAVGLKENFFLLVVVHTFYYMMRYGRTRQVRPLMACLLWMCGALLFRTAIFAMLLASLGVCATATVRHRRRVLFIILVGGVVAFLSLDTIISLLYGKNLSDVLHTTDYRMQNVEAGTTGNAWLIQSLAVFFGPFPNFSHMSEYALVHSAGLIVKGLLGFFLLKGLWRIIRRYDHPYYILLTYYIGSFAMLVIGGVSLDFRYQVIMFPPFIPLIAREMNRRIPLYQWLSWCGMLFILILLYNNR